jgi:hypothetical protein
VFGRASRLDLFRSIRTLAVNGPTDKVPNGDTLNQTAPDRLVHSIEPASDANQTALDHSVRFFEPDFSDRNGGIERGRCVRFFKPDSSDRNGGLEHQLAR